MRTQELGQEEELAAVKSEITRNGRDVLFVDFVLETGFKIFARYRTVDGKLYEITIERKPGMTKKSVAEEVQRKMQSVEASPR